MSIFYILVFKYHRWRYFSLYCKDAYAKYRSTDFNECVPLYLCVPLWMWWYQVDKAVSHLACLWKHLLEKYEIKLLGDLNQLQLFDHDDIVDKDKSIDNID